MDGIVDDSIELPEEGWVELPRTEAMVRIERFQTQDLAMIDIICSIDPTAVGRLETYTWVLVSDDGDEQPALLMLRDPTNRDNARWFIYHELIEL